MLKFNILFILPIIDKDMILEDIGICSITSVLRENNFTVKLMAVTKDELSYNEIIDFQPDIIGLPIYSPTVDLVFELCQNLKRRLPEVNICLGGKIATFHSKEILEIEKSIDFIVKGEGELVFLELVKKLSIKENFENIKGLAYRKNNEIIENEQENLIENLDDLPLPARDVLIKYQLRTAVITTSRGCSRNCSFCCSHHFWKTKDHKYKWRGRSYMKVVDEIESLYRDHNVKHFWFSDPSFEDPGFNEVRMKQIAQEIINRNLKISYYIYVRASFYRHASEELMNLLLKSGLCTVFIGIESANKFDLKIYGKSASLNDNYEVIKFFEKHHVSVEIGFMNFNPYSTFEGIRENAKFLEQSGQAGNIFLYNTPLRVYKGSDIYQRLQNDNLIKRTKINDDFGYEFKDKRITLLIDYLNDFYQILKDNDILYYIFIHARYHPDKLALFKRYFYNSDQGVAQLIDAHETNHKEIFSKIGQRVIPWFYELIDITENGWDKTKAANVTNKYLDISALKEILSHLNNERIRFLKNLAKLNKEYITFL